MTKISFIKMHGAGNDFVVIDNREVTSALSEAQVMQLADRRYGIGCDQLVVLENLENHSPFRGESTFQARNASAEISVGDNTAILPPTKSAEADLTPGSGVYMRIYNADGSQIDACGNATRCIGWLLMQEQDTDAATIQTGAGLLHCARAGDQRVSVNMGEPQMEWNQIPLAERRNTEHLGIAEGKLMDPFAVNMGNPHAVFFVSDVDSVPLEKVGPILETHPLFPERANISVAQILNERSIKLRVWERGSGITLACGTAACATLVAAVKRGLIKGRSATIQLPGGDLHIEWRDDNSIDMTGPVAEVFRGEIKVEA